MQSQTQMSPATAPDNYRGAPATGLSSSLSLSHSHCLFNYSPPGAPYPFSASSITNTQSFPSFGGVNVFVPLPFTLPAEVALPSRGLNHQTFLISPVIAPRLTRTGLACGIWIIA